jgi:hypothetical protein
MPTGPKGGKRLAQPHHKGDARVRQSARTVAPVSLLLLCLAAGPTFAQSRPESIRMTCREAAALVFQRGGIVLGTGGYTYDRFVRDRSFCAITEVTKVAFAPTLDNAQCFVGYTCIEPSGERDNKE